MPTIAHNIGQLRHYITIQEETATARNDYNETTETWGTLTDGQIWARVESLAGQELIEARQVHGNVSHKVTARWLDGVERQMRVVHDGRVFNIESVLNVEERDWIMVIYATEAV